MADYYAVLKKAVAGLGTNSSETRRAIYEKARTALIGQLKAIDPPLTTAEISRQRLELEESIRRVEREAAAAQPAARTEPVAPAVPANLPEPEPEPEEAADADEPDAPFEGVALELRAEQDAPELHGPPAAPPAAAAVVPPRPPAGPPAPPPVARPRAESPALPEDERPELRADPFDAPVRLRGRRDPSPERPAAPSAGAAPVPVPPPAAARGEDDGWREPPLRASPRQDTPSVDDAAPPRRRDREAQRVDPTFGDYDGERDRRDGVAPIPSMAGERPEEPVKGRRRARLAEPGGDGRDDGRDNGRDMGAARSRPSRLPGILLFIMIVAVLAGLGALAWSQRAFLAEVVSSFDQVAAPAPDEPAQETSAKSTDRVPSAGGVPNDRPVRTVGEQEGVPPPAQAQAPAAEPAAEPPAAPAATSGQAPAAGVAVSQKAMLYEESADKPGEVVAEVESAITWRFEADGPDGPVVHADIRVPERQMDLRMSIRKNNDASLPASHLIEIVVDAPAGTPASGITAIPRIVLKETEQQRGDPIIGASAKVADGFFWIAFSSVEGDIETNLAMLRDREWFDLPLLYPSGQRAILTFEKGMPGEQAIAQALQAWEN